MKYQLWSRDEYGTSSIVGTFSTSEEALQKGRSLVTDANFNNSLSSGEQLKTIEAYMVELDKGVYAGMSQNKHSAFTKGAAAPLKELPTVNVYIGSKFANKDSKKVESKVYMKDEKGKTVNSLDHASLRGKTVYFVRPISE